MLYLPHKLMWVSLLGSVFHLVDLLNGSTVCFDLVQAIQSGFWVLALIY